MNRLRRNALSNLIGTGWAALLNIAFVPVFVHLLGIESYGLIGVFAALQAGLSLLDLGLSPALSRELARYSALAGGQRDANDLARTLELVYWLVGISVGLAITASSGLIATHWINQTTLPVEVVRRAIAMMGLVVAAQWPMTLYISGLQGLQRQVLLNAINVVIATVRFGGAAAVLTWGSRNVGAFFSWQLLVSAVGTLCLFAAFWRCMPRGAARPTLRWPLLRSVWRFAAGVAAIAVISLILTHADKVVLTRLVPLAEFGYYSIAVLVSQSLVLFSGPIVRAVFPRFSQLAATGDTGTLSALYHRACQVLATGVVSAGLVLVVFSREVLTLWTHNAETTEHTYLLVSLLVTGSVFLALQTVPYFLALANGWTTLNIRMGIITVLVAFPLLLIAAARFGGAGAAAVWILINAGTTPFYLYYVHRRFLPHDLGRWWIDDFLKPVIGAAIPVAIGRALLPAGVPQVWLAVALAIISLTSLAGAALACSEVRQIIRPYFRPSVRTLRTNS